MHTRRFSPSILLTSIALVALAADKGGGSGGGEKEKPKSLEDKLTAVEGERDKANSDLATVTTERDELKTENGRIQAQFDELVKSNDLQKAELTAAKDEVVKLTADRDGLTSKLVVSDKNVERLESLCKVRGIDPKSAPPELERSQGGGQRTREVILAELDKTTDSVERGQLANELRELSLKKKV